MVPPLRDDDAAMGNANIHENETANGLGKESDGSSMRVYSASQKNEAIEKPNNHTPQVSFSHVQLYVDYVEDVTVYKDLENKLNLFAAKNVDKGELSDQRKVWKMLDSCPGDDNDTVNGISQPTSMQKFESQNRDVVKQLIAGLGFRVTGHRMMPTSRTNTRSVLVTSSDPKGVQFIVTSIDHDSAEQEQYHHFDAGNVRRFYNAHNSRQGVAVLAFQVTSVDEIYGRYMEKHPNLILNKAPYLTTAGNSDCKCETKVLEVFAYYLDDACSSTTTGIADEGTVLRFVEVLVDDDDSNRHDKTIKCALPGLIPVDAIFDEHCQAAYCDHWVSNVNSRIGFLTTLEDTLDFTPKVDFNAGVVAAGEAQIESTVTGNDSIKLADDETSALKDQSQVYLPINNALSDVGHVHGFLKEIGQGIQHVASKVENLVEFVQRGNEYRKITGEGFTFLNIPRSYYGTLSKRLLIEGAKKKNGKDNDQGLSEESAEEVMRVCRHCKITSKECAVDIDITKSQIDDCLEESLQGGSLEEYKAKKEAVLDTIMHSRYVNLYSLLRNHISEETYLGIVRNQILVDVQGEDLLYQIFTCNILQRKAGEEAPFFEFIQRVCSECKDEDGCPVKMKPGCGGFGIRNFLTLFLSIEVSKAMMEASRAQQAGDANACKYAQEMVGCFTNQLNESNPILTSISDAMTEEGYCKERLQNADEEEKNNNAKNAGDTVAYWKSRMAEASLAKAEGNKKLMDCSAKYKDLMRRIREQRDMELKH